jgi:3-phenylpropionate/trans-cinnamate dioxygenase ferredoxin reductase component
MSPREIVLVGGGLATTRCARTLRSKGYDGRLTMLCGEDHAPYDRPPLSKAQLATPDPQPAWLRPEGWWAENDVELRLGSPAVRLLAGERRLRLQDGSELPYDRLLVATGATPRPAPGALAQASNVHTLRDLADTRRLHAELVPGARLIVIGAGLIGLEVAATAHALGCAVTVLEAAPHPLARALPRALADWLVDLHRRRGVTVELDVRVATVEQHAGRVSALTLDDGRTLGCDVVLAAIGVEPHTGWLAGSPLPDRGGIPVDAGGRTALPDVLAAGDCALTPDLANGLPRRSDHWEAAVHTGRAVALSMLDLPAGPTPPPGFWTDQHGIRVQVVGEAARADAMQLDGSLDADDFHAHLTRDGRLVAGAAADRPRALPAFRKRLTQTPERTAA